MLGFPIHCSQGLRLLGFQLLGFYRNVLQSHVSRIYVERSPVPLSKSSSRQFQNTMHIPKPVRVLMFLLWVFFLLRVPGAFFLLLRVRGAFFLLRVRVKFTHARLILRARGWGSSEIQWGVGRPAAGAFFVAAGARLRVRGKFTHSLAAGLRASTAERHPGSGARFFLLRVRELTDSRVARRPEHPQKKKHPQQKKKKKTGSIPKP